MELAILKDNKPFELVDIATVGQDIPFTFEIKNISPLVLNNINLHHPTFIELASKVPDSLIPNESAKITVLVKGHVTYKAPLHFTYSYIKVDVK